MYNQQQGLPASAQQLEHPALNPAEVPPPMIPSAQQIQQNILMAYHVELITQLQNGANRSPLRTFMFNLAAQNNYYNQYYQELLETVLQLAMAMGGQNPNNVVSQALLAEMSSLATNYPAIGQYLTSDQHYELQRLHQHRAELAQMMRGGMQQPMGHPSTGIQQQMGMGHPYGGQMGRPAAPNRSGFPQQTSAMGGRPTTVSGRAGHTHQPAPMGQPTTMRRSGQNAPLTQGPSRPASNMIDRGQNAAPDFRKPAMTSVSATTKINNPADKDEDMIVADSDNRDLGHFSEVHDQKLRFPKAIDRPTNLTITNYVPTGNSALKPVSRVVNQKLTYSLISKEHSAMDYEAHELNYKLKKFHRDGIPGPRVMEVPADWKGISQPSILEESDTKETVQDIPAHEAVCVHGFIKATDLQTARVLIVNVATKRGLKRNDERAIEGYVKLGKPYPAEQNDVYAIKELLEQPDLTGFVDALVEIANNDEISQGFYYALHDRLTETLNRRVQAGLALRDWSIESIVRDYEDLMNELGKEVQTTSLDRFKRATLNQLKGVIEADISKANEGLITFEERVSITQVPWSSNQIGLEFNDTYTQLTSAIDVHFLSAMAHLLRRTSGKNPITVNRRFLVTSDNQWLEVHHSDIGADNIILSQV